MKIAIRILWYWIKVLVALLAVLGMMGWAFLTAMDVANIYVLVGEGVKLRTEVILQNGLETDLKKCFTDEFVRNDTLRKDNPYKKYNVINYEVHSNVEWVWAWTWKDTATAIITQRVLSISGEPTSSALSQSPDMDRKPPKWESAKYRITLKRTDLGWKIDNMVMVENVPDRFVPQWQSPSPKPTEKPIHQPT